MPLPETGVNDRLDDLKTLIAATNTALDTLNGNISAITYNSAFIPDMAAHIAACRAAIAPSGEALPTGVKTSIAWAMWRLMDAVATPYPRGDAPPLLTALENFNQLYQAVNGVPTLDGTSILSGIIALIDNLGLPTGDATTTALGLLAQIATSNLCACPPGPPSSSDPAGCASPVVSLPGGITDTEHYPGLLFATWSRPIFDGAAFVSVLDPAVAGDVEIELDSGRSGWKMYVQSSAPTFSFTPATGSRHPTNTWVDIPNLDLAVNVASAYDLVVYICVPEESLCGTYASETLTLTATGGGSSTAATINMDDVPLTSPSTSANISGTTYTATGNAFAHTDGHGWTVTVVANESGQAIRIGSTGTSDNYGAATIHTVGESYTIDRETHAWWVDRAFDVATPTAPFTVEICRPSGD